MNYRHAILLILLLFVSSIGYGQKKTKKKGKRQQTSFQLIEKARAIKEKAPTEAIALVEQAITLARREKDRFTEGEAYWLLGDIYDNIDQKDLALQRYQQALPLIQRKKKTNKEAAIYERMGQIYLDLKDGENAKANFLLCLEFKGDKIIVLKCEEGLADAQLLQKEATVEKQLDNIVTNYKMDSLTTARNEARRAQAYAQKKDYSKASELLNNALNSLPENQEISAEDYEPIQKAQDEILILQDASPDDELLLQNTFVENLRSNIPNETQITENLKLAELYESEADLPGAEKYILESKNLITPETDAAVAAAVYKKSSEINSQQEKMAAALRDLEAYTTAKEKAITQLETELKAQVEIVKGQQQIDLRQREFDLDEKDQALMQSQLTTQRVIIGLLSLLLIGSMVFFYFLYKNVKAKRKANQALLLKSLRTQMNPHFIFNALNSVNNFIAKNDEKAANKFLADFSKLMRKVLDHSQKDFIAFEEEIELNELYLKLEHFRFRDKFEYQFENNAATHGYDLEVPPMLIQPFIENAVWHGLRYKEGKGKLHVRIDAQDHFLSIQIQDNGIGREKSQRLKTSNQKKYKSTGLENVNKRITLINDLYDKHYEIKVTDVDSSLEDTGTLVEIKIPTLKS